MRTFASLRITAILLPLIALFLGGCTKQQQEEVESRTVVDITYPAIPFTIDSGDVSGQYEVNLAVDPAVLAQVMTAHNYSIAQLADFTFTKANLFLTSPVTGNYNALQSVTLQVAVDQSPPVTVASLNPVPSSAQTLILHMGDADVLDLMKSSNVHFIFKVQLDGPLPPVSGHSLVLGAKLGVKL